MVRGIADGHCRRLEAAIGERCDYLPCVRGAVCSFACEPAPPDAICP